MEAAAEAFSDVSCDEDPSAGSIFSSSLPWATRSPTLTLTSVIVPGNGAGTSIVALSDSSVSSGSSVCTVSPAETRISITGTSSKSPMSGTSTETMLVALIPLVGIGASGSIS